MKTKVWFQEKVDRWDDKSRDYYDLEGVRVAQCYRACGSYLASQVSDEDATDEDWDADHELRSQRWDTIELAEKNMAEVLGFEIITGEEAAEYQGMEKSSE